MVKKGVISKTIKETTIRSTIPAKRTRKKIRSKKRKSPRKSTTKSKTSKYSSKIIKLLIDNSVSLQKILTTHANKMDKLTDSITRLLDIFEEAAKSFSASPLSMQEVVKESVKKEKVKEETEDLINKLDNLLEQNKTIANGIILLEKKMRETVGEGKIKPLPEFRF